MLLSQFWGSQDLNAAHEPVYPAQKFPVRTGGKLDLVVQVLPLSRRGQDPLAGVTVAPFTDEQDGVAVKADGDLCEGQLTP